VNNKEFPQEAERIRKLMVSFDAAVWKRISASETMTIEELLKDDVYPKSAEETAVWNELTSPENREALHKFIAYHGENVHDYARKLNAALVKESDRRAGAKTGGANNGPPNSGI
jgi:hypothetical protein